MKLDCFQCGKEMQEQQWTKGILIYTCETCKIRKYYSFKLSRIMTDEEINRLEKDWE